MLLINGVSQTNVTNIVSTALDVSKQFTYPNLGSAIQVNTGVTAWTLGNFVQIIPENFIEKQFKIRLVNFELLSDDTTFQLNLYTGPINFEVLIAQTRVTRTGVQVKNDGKHLDTPTLLPLTRISCRLASAANAQKYALISVDGYEIP